MVHRHARPQTNRSGNRVLEHRHGSTIFVHPNRQPDQHAGQSGRQEGQEGQYEDQDQKVSQVREKVKDENF